MFTMQKQQTTSPKTPAKPVGMTYTTVAIYDIKFVKAWITKQTVDEVCRKMQITPQQAYVKANSLRKKGVKLPKKRAPHVKVDKSSVDELNKLIERMSK